MGLVREFREFAIKGNMIDMAVGIIIGSAFNSVVDVLVKQILMPPLRILTDGFTYAENKYVIREAFPATGTSSAIEEIAVGYGLLIEVILDFLIIGFTVFMVVKIMNRFRRKAENPKDKSVVPARDVQLLENIKLLLEEQNALLKKKDL